MRSATLSGCGRARCARPRWPEMGEAAARHAFLALLERRIAVLDGAMGTMLQRHRLCEEDFRGARFADWSRDVRGNNDLLTLTQPQLVAQIHRDYLDAGADVVTTNTFNSSAISQADYGMQGLIAELNLCAAQLARR